MIKCRRETVHYEVISTLEVQEPSGETKVKYVILREAGKDPSFTEPSAIPADCWETVPPLGSIIEVERLVFLGRT